MVLTCENINSDENSCNSIDNKKVFFEKLKQTTGVVLGKVNSFMNSDWFLAFMAAVVVVLWVTRAQTIGFILMMGLFSILLCCKKNLKPALVVLCYFIFFVSDIKRLMEPDFIVAIIFCLPALIIGVIVYFVRNVKKVKLSQFVVAMLIAQVGAILGGIGFETYTVIGVSLSLLLGVMCLGFYIIFSNGLKNCELKNYSAKLMMYAGIIVLIQTFIFYCRVDNLLDSFRDKTLDLAWGISNNVGVIFNMAIPMTLFLATKSKFSPVHICLVIAFSIGTVFTFSRGNIIFLMLAIIPLMVYMYIKTKQKKAFLITIGAFLLICIILLIAFNDLVVEIFEVMIGKGLSGSGRENLYKEAIKAFFTSPVFGIGWYKSMFIPLTYHCTALQILASTGIVGTLLILPFFIKKYSYFFKKTDCYKFFALMSVLLCEAYGMMDLMLYLIYLNFYAFTFIIAIENDAAKEQENMFGGFKKQFVDKAKPTDISIR